MQVQFSGWRRDCGAWTVAEKDLSAIKLEVPPLTLSSNKTYFYRNNPNEVVVALHAGKLTLNGDFKMCLRLTHDDIAAIVSEALRR